MKFQLQDHYVLLWWVSFVCTPVQMWSRCHCRCHCRSHMHCRYLIYKCKWELSIKCSKQYEWLQNTQWRKARWSHVITAHSIVSVLNADFIKLCNMQPKLHDRIFITKLHFVIYNQLFLEAYRAMLCYTWQNAGYNIGEPVDNFTSVIDVAFSTDIIQCAVMTCDHFAFLHCAFCSHS